MSVTVGILYPGYSAEDDYPRAEKLLADGSRLALVHTEMREDAHRVDALLDIGGDDVLGGGCAGGGRAGRPARLDRLGVHVGQLRVRSGRAPVTRW